MEATRTVILGAGFGGLAAAHALRELLPPDHEVVVVDQAPRFYVGAGKTWIMLGERTFNDISQARQALIPLGVRLVQAAVQSIDVVSRDVVLGDEVLSWDFLVVALGADLNMGKIPGLAAAAETFYTVEGAERLRGVLDQFNGGDLVLLIPRLPFKCPPAPYEAAMLLHDAFEARGMRPRVNLSIHTAEGAPMGTAGPEMGQFIKGELASRNIAYFPQRVTARVDVAARRVAFEDGSEAAYDLLIAIPPHEAPAVVREAGLTASAGWIPVNPATMQVMLPAAEDVVYAAGDITTVPLPGRFKPDAGLVLPKAGVFASGHGRVAAHQIAARVLGKTTEVTFDGRGYCFLEVGGQRAIRAEGDFFALPHPIMQKKTPDEAQFNDKLSWVANLLSGNRQ